jgi:hypothetical protein
MQIKQPFSLLIWACTVVLLTAAPHASAQAVTSGSLMGTVTDSSGAYLPGATVTLTNVATGISTSAQTTVFLKR